MDISPETRQEILTAAVVYGEILSNHSKQIRDLPFHPLSVDAMNVDFHVQNIGAELQCFSHILAKAEDVLAKTKSHGELIMDQWSNALSRAKARMHIRLLQMEPGMKVTDAKAHMEVDPHIIDIEDKMALAKNQTEINLSQAKMDVAIVKGMLDALRAKEHVLPGEQQRRNLLLRIGDGH